MGHVRRGEQELQERFETLLSRHTGIVIRVVRTYTRDSEDQLDLAQEIKVQLWRAFPQYDERRVFSTWMYRIALNTAISWNRRLVNRRESTVTLDDIRDHSIERVEDEEQQILWSLIDELDPMNRALLLLYLDEVSHATIGEILGITAGNVATKLNRIKQHLKQKLTKE